jgi:hypothetical protein
LGIELTTMRTQMRQAKPVAKLSFEDAWQRRATEAAIAAARGVVKPDGPIQPLTPVGRLGDAEWGWIVAAILFGWIATRAQQATTENLDVQQTVRASAVNPDPWDIGAILTIMPELAEACSGLDLSLPLASWSREAMAEFLLTALRLIEPALAARDLSEHGITRKASTHTIARQANAAAGGPLLAPDEWDDLLGI